MSCSNKRCEGCDNGEWRVIFEEQDGKMVTRYPLMCLKDFGMDVRQDPKVRLKLRGDVVNIDDCCADWKPIGG